MNGIIRISEAFYEANKTERAALMPYITLGFPSVEQTLPIVQTLVDQGADLIELGVPFSDPLADGPTIQHSTQVALENGMSVARCLELVREIRARGIETPLLLMGYINPILAFGASQYVQAANEAGADGLIVPDLPLEESAEMEAYCRAEGLALVYLATPNSTPERLRQLCEHTSGFLYLVSLTGVTGARQNLSDGLGEFIQRARSMAHTPVAVGFGISTPEQAARVGRSADGVIIGSALIDAVGSASDPAMAAGEFIRGIRKGLEGR